MTLYAYPMSRLNKRMQAMAFEEKTMPKVQTNPIVDKEMTKAMNEMTGSTILSNQVAFLIKKK
ncbi:MAG: hypothetical protein LKG27_05675 [Clostridiaceae bacterium]|jgi:hypothetical protein|nr:hypothetical protein [Clostridiaceae bacterium]